MDDKHTEVRRLEFGPGIRHAVIWLSIISSFGAGWYMKGEQVEGELASAQLTVFKEDVEAKEENRTLKAKAKSNLEDKREGRKYDKTCGDMSISDFIK